MARSGGKGGGQAPELKLSAQGQLAAGASPGAPRGPSEIPQAKQHYDPDRKETIRTGKCPTHSRTHSSRFLGVQGDYWAFHCPAGGEAFLNRPAGQTTNELG